MKDKLRNRYFLMVRTCLLLGFCTHGLLYRMEETGASPKMLLLLAVFISCFSLKEISFSHLVSGNPGKYDKHMLMFAGLFAGVILGYFQTKIGGAYILLTIFWAYEILSSVVTEQMIRGRRVSMVWYVLPAGLLLFPTPVDRYTVALVLVLTMFLYVQHDFVVRFYRKQNQEDTLLEQRLKKDLVRQEYETKAELQKNILKAENKILEDRAALAQTLHDKLGHGINGSIYQLEAIKLLMESDPDKAQAMTQAVIDQLRVSMDEIRGILRKERPEKKDMSLLQLYKLCEDCEGKGVEATLETEGDIDQVPQQVWEVILDNAFEAVTNALKYAKCKKIDIKIIVMNQMIRCSIADDGAGCYEIKEGMGIAGMRRRVREAGGSIGFESQGGFTVNMLLPFTGGI